MLGQLSTAILGLALAGLFFATATASPWWPAPWWIAGAITPPSGAMITLGTPEDVTIAGWTGGAEEPFISADGQYLFWNTQDTGDGLKALHYATCSSGTSCTYVGTITDNAGDQDVTPNLVGSTFYWISNRQYVTDQKMLFKGAFSAGTVGSIAVVDGDFTIVEPFAVNIDAAVSPDGNKMFFSAAHLFGPGILVDSRITMASKTGSTFTLDAGGASILASINSVGKNYAAAISADGLELYFTRWLEPADPVLMVSTRLSTSAAFGAPQLLRSGVFVEGPALSGDMGALYWHERAAGGGGSSVIKRAAITRSTDPVVAARSWKPGVVMGGIFKNRQSGGTAIASRSWGVGMALGAIFKN
jgi:hypothetical protein